MPMQRKSGPTGLPIPRTHTFQKGGGRFAEIRDSALASAGTRSAISCFGKSIASWIAGQRCSSGGLRMSAGEEHGTSRGGRLPRKQDSMGRIVLCAGLKSSGSTWLYNAIIQLCESGFRRGSQNKGPRRVLPFYADRIEDFPPGADSADLLVIKTHVPSPALAFLTSFARGTVLFT